MKKFFFIALIGIFSKSYSQTDYSEIYHNDSIIKKGINFHNSEKFNEAIIEYNKIIPNDPKYLTAQYEIERYCRKLFC